jgi:hypothetical protein
MRSSSRLTWIRETQVKINAEAQRDGVEAVRERVKVERDDDVVASALAKLFPNIDRERINRDSRLVVAAARKRGQRIVAKPTSVRRRTEGQASAAQPLHHTRLRRATPRRRRETTRASSSSSDDPGDSEPPAVDWRWASEASWRSFVESVRAWDVEREIQRERDGGQAA